VAVVALHAQKPMFQATALKAGFEFALYIPVVFTPNQGMSVRLLSKDTTTCEKCRDPVRHITGIEDPVITRILHHR